MPPTEDANVPRRGFSRRRFLAWAALGVGTPAGMGVARWRSGAGAFPAGTPDDEAPELVENADAADRGDDFGTRRVIWSVPEAGPLVALTFDDGPHPDLTPPILRVLDDAGVRATFNMMGHAAESNPHLAKAVVAAGHDIGNHTSTHLDLARQDRATTAAQLRDGTEAIRRVTGVSPRWFRPPKGHLTGALMREAARLGQDVVLWSTSGGVPGARTADEIVRTTMNRLQPGAVVCLHDGVGRGLFNPGQPWLAELLRLRRLEVEALPALIAAIEDRGMRCVTLSELVEAGHAAA